jgi:exopolysaccharide biosynthesis polyprenyl glycosylphosphotransferase
VRSVCRAAVFISCFAVPVGIGWIHAERYGYYEFGSRFSTWWLVAYGALFALSAFALGIPALVHRPSQAVLGSVLAASVPLALASVFFLVVDPPIRSRLIVVGPTVVLFFVFLVFSALHGWTVRRSARNDRVLMVAGDTDRIAFERDLRRPPERKFTLLAVVRPDEIERDANALGTLISDTNANLVVLSEASQASPSIVQQAAQHHEEGVRIRALAAFDDEWLGKFPINELARTSLWFDIRDLHEGQYNRLKRLMDLSIALAALPVFVLLIPVVAVGNLIGNRGPLFFRQPRVGQQNETFDIWKFRTMTADANVDGVGTWTSTSDPRVTPFGKLLRKSHLDELPQVLNVLAGDLSIVGPRPEQPHYVRSLTETIPFYSLRHSVKPGVTGWAQVKYPYGASEEDAMEKLQYELFYLRHQSLSLDLRICARTLRTMLLGEGR